MARERKKLRTAKQEVRTLTDVEWVIMKAVWESEPCAAGTVQEALAAEFNWAYSTVKTTMDRMVAKGLLSTESIRNLQLFKSTISRDDAQRIEIRQLLRRAFDGALAPLLQFLVDTEELTATDIKELRGLQRNCVDCLKEQITASRSINTKELSRIPMAEVRSYERQRINWLVESVRRSVLAIPYEYVLASGLIHVGTVLFGILAQG